MIVEAEELSQWFKMCTALGDNKSSIHRTHNGYLFLISMSTCTNMYIPPHRHICIYIIKYKILFKIMFVLMNST